MFFPTFFFKCFFLNFDCFIVFVFFDVFYLFFF